MSLNNESYGAMQDSKSRAFAAPVSVDTRSDASVDVEHYAFCDALRTVAILLVVISHALGQVNFLSIIWPACRPIGYWGVDAFFVLSGFLLGRPYVDALLRRREMPRASLYAKRRFLRIWPAYAVVVVIGAAITHLHHGHNPATLSNVIAHLAMIHNFFPSFVQTAGNSALWTMGVDTQFYVALPIAAWLLLRYGPSNERAMVRLIVSLVVAQIGVAFAWRTFCIFAFPTLVTTVAIDVIERSLPGMGLCFAIGGGLALFQALQIAIARKVMLFFGVFGIAFAAAVFSAPYWFPVPWLLFEPTFWDFFGTASVGLILIAGLHARSVRLNRLVESRLVAIVATNAYALYLVHMPVMFTVFFALQARAFHLNVGSSLFSIVLVLVFVITAAISAIVLHRFVEKPYLTIKERSREVVAVL